MAIKILTALPDGTTGEYLRYDPVYDAIRQAREEDDARLSRGVWEIDLKKADPHEVEQLCVDALTTRTKDFQLVSWLCEAWCRLQGIDGLTQGIKLMTDFCHAYWEEMHPVDAEHRSRLFEWIQKDFNILLHTYPIVRASGSDVRYTYHQYLAAKALDQAAKRDPQNAQTIIDRAMKKGDINIFQFTTALSQTPSDRSRALGQSLLSLREAMLNFRNSLDEKLGADAPTFANVLTSAKDMASLLGVEEDTAKKSETAITEGGNMEPNDVPEGKAVSESVPSPQTHSPRLETRRDAYEKLRALSDLFERIEPHSPTTSILKTAVLWEHKELSEILEMFNQGSSALSVFLNFMKTPTSGTQENKS